MSRLVNARQIAAARWFPLATMSLACNEGDKHCVTVTPKSRTDSTIGRMDPLIVRFVLQITRPMLSIQHLLTDTDNCHSSAQSSVFTERKSYERVGLITLLDGNGKYEQKQLDDSLLQQTWETGSTFAIPYLDKLMWRHNSVVVAQCGRNLVFRCKMHVVVDKGGISKIRSRHWEQNYFCQKRKCLHVSRVVRWDTWYVSCSYRPVLRTPSQDLARLLLLDRFPSPESFLRIIALELELCSNKHNINVVVYYENVSGYGPAN